MNALGQERGFTVAEVLLAAAIVALAFVALATIIPISTYAVQEGNQFSTATFLAGQKLELVRNVPWTSASANDCLGLSASATAAPDTVLSSSPKTGRAAATTRATLSAVAEFLA